ncbi:histone acetyltransferase 1 [Tieghemiomyces parasiticus]|uniref:Histone acetyltransferase type B catalytic subunit n=1 Tax=Tieghemiomyces parasiticus TaxID=78921 RepID=A0A9W8AF69_9FUNG|nr:histone acetyltransferase 1 [Tieghemiomyces parasiticus]
MNTALPESSNLDYDTWVADANEALQFHLVDTNQLAEHDATDVLEAAPGFSPDYTYPLFGEKEKIFGFRDLAVDLYFSQAALKCHLSVKFSAARTADGSAVSAVKAEEPGSPPAKRAKLATDTAVASSSSGSHGNETSQTSIGGLPQGAEEILNKLREAVVIDSVGDITKFLSSARQAGEAFRPYGTRIHEYCASAPRDHDEDDEEKGDEEENVSELFDYEIYHTTFDTPGFADYHRRLQSFLLFYIEGASFIEENDPHWDIYTIYQRRTSEANTTIYALVGYATVHRFFNYPDRIRPRISQYLILPPYAGVGHGSTLYRLLYERWLADPAVTDFSVEDPNDAFSELRDKCDVRFLLENVPADQLPTSFDTQVLKEFRHKWKFGARQAARCLEIITLKRLDPNDKAALRRYRLQVKKRIYLQNQDTLISMDHQERIQKLDETFKAVDEGYKEFMQSL